MVGSVYVCHKEMAFLDRLGPIDVLMGVIGLDHFMMLNVISLGYSICSPPSSSFKMNMPHLELEDFRGLILSVCNLFP